MRRVRAWWVVVAVAAAAGAAATVYYFHAPYEGRTYRIGWEHDPPVQVAREGAEPTGLAVEIVREAARRQGVRLQWVRRNESSESALRSRAVDLWPLVTVTEERRRHFYLSDPYLNNEHVFIVAAASRVAGAEDLAESSIAFHQMPFNEQILREHCPEARLRPTPSLDASLQSLCRGESDAVFLEEHAAISLLLKGAPCPGQSLRMISTGGIQALLAIGAAFEARAAADAIRDEIGNMADDGELREIFLRWGRYSGPEIEALNQLVSARRRLRTYRIGMAGLALLLASAVGSAVAFRRERNRARVSDRARRQAEQRLKLVTDNLSEMVLAFDMDRNLTYANPGVERLTGYSVDEIRSRGFICWIHPHDTDRMLSFWGGLFEGKSFEQEEYRLITKDGRQKWASATWGPIFDESGRQVGVHGSERDITRIKQAEEEHALLADRLQQSQKMEAIGRLAGGVAHDFNNLLTVINGYGNLLQSRLSAESQERGWAAEISQAGDRAAGLVRQLLTFSRKQLLEPRVLDMNELVGNLERMLLRLLGERIELVTRMGSSVGFVRADAGQLEQVVLNLVVNARDAMPDGGRLVLETDHVELAGACAHCGSRVRPGPYVRLMVKDSGAGMDEETRKQIFEPFFTTKGPGAGTGLGLSIVHGIVCQSDGHIDVESEPGAGTTFFVFLPRAEQAVSPQAASGPRGVPDGKGTILLAEDQPEVRRFAATALRAAGYRVLEAGDGEEALAVCSRQSGPIDLLLTDLIMPRMGGREAATRMREIRPETRVLYMSGYAEDMSEPQSDGDTRPDFIQKPFLSPELVSVVSRVLAQGSAGGGG